MNSKTIIITCHVERHQASTSWKTDIQGEIDNETAYLLIENIIDKLHQRDSSMIIRALRRLFKGVL